MDTITAKELASLAGVPAKRMRSFIRAQDEKGTGYVTPVGQGARYAFSPAEAKAILDAYASLRASVRSNAPARSVDELHALLDAAGEDACNGL